MNGQIGSSRRWFALLARWFAPVALVLAAGCGGSPDGTDAVDKGDVGAADSVVSEEFAGGERAPKTKVFTPNSDSAEQIALATELSLQHLAGNIERLGVDSLDDLEMRAVWIDELGMAHAKLQQLWKGVEVFGAHQFGYCQQSILLGRQGRDAPRRQYGRHGYGCG